LTPISRGLRASLLNSLAIDNVGAVLESFRELSKCRVKHAPHDETKRFALEFIGNAKFDEASFAFLAIMKDPVVFKMLKGSVDIFD
jgi:hypothetical protein